MCLKNLITPPMMEIGTEWPHPLTYDQPPREKLPDSRMRTVCLEVIDFRQNFPGEH